MGSSVLTQHVHMEKHLGIWRAEFIKIGLQWSLMAPHPRQAGQTISRGTSLSFTAVDPVPPSARVIGTPGALEAQRQALPQCRSPPMFSAHLENTHQTTVPEGNLR